MMKKRDFSEIRLALLAHAPEEEWKGGIKTVLVHLRQAFPKLEIFPKPEWCAKTGSSSRQGGIWYVDWFKEDWKYSRLLRQRHTQHPWDLLFTYSCTGIPLNAGNMGIPCIHLYLGCFKEFARQTFKSRWEALLQGTVVGWMDRKSGKNKFCTVPSLPVQAEIKRHYGLESEVIPAGVEIGDSAASFRPEARAKLRLGTDQKIGLYVGRLEYAKGQDILLELAKALPFVTFVCVTDTQGFFPSLPNLVIRKDISPEEQKLWCQASDFFFLPTRYESASYVMLEAMSFNLPVVASRRVGQVIFDPFPGIGPEEGVYICGDLPEYREAIARCLSMKQMPQTRAFVETHHSLGRFCENYQNLVLNLLKLGF